jgi:PAS domain S-box-containing protein
MKNGVCQRVIGVLQDITVQHESLAQLRLLETCVSHLNDIVLITEAEPLDSPGPCIVFVNDAFERRTGYSREEILGQSPRMLQGPNTQRSELDRIGVALKKWQPVRAELINYTKGGEQFWIELDIVPIADSTGWYTHWVAIERDITQRKIAEKALVESEHRYTALFETAPVPMWVIDRKTGRFLMVNSAAVQAYGYSSEELLSMTLLDIRPESEHARLRTELADAIPGSERSEPWIHRRKDGSVFPASIFARSIKYDDKVLRFIVALDVTAQVKAEKEVQEHLFTLQRAADAAQAITWHQTLDGTLQEVVEQARGVIGANQAVVSLDVGGDLLPAITAVSLSAKYAPYRDQVKVPDGTGIYSMVSERNRAVRMTQAELEAHPRWRAYGTHAEKHPPMRGWLAVPLTNRSGQNMGVLQLSDKYEGEFTQQDEYVAIELAQLASIALQNAQLIEQVSQLNTGLERKVAERTVALARQEALFRALAEQAPQVVWTSDAQGAITYLNQAWFELVGGALQDWTGSGWVTVIHPEDLPETKANWKVSEATGCPYVGIRRLRVKDGSYHTMSYRASPVLDAQGAVLFWVGIDADITEVKSIEAALRLSNQELEAFSYSVSHDLRSPLNTIDGFSRLLSKHLNADENVNVNVKGQHYLSRIQAGVAQMGKLIEDLLSLSQVSRMQLNYEHIDLSALSQHILDEWSVRQPERRVHIDIESGLQAQGDVRLVRGMMENLLGNAWKFTSKQPDARIYVGQKLDAAGVPVFFIKDNGAGFDMAYAEKLFVAFQRLHTLSEFPGTGIGLATVSRVVARHGGRLWAESAPEQGATFFFTLPGTLPFL